MARIAGVDIPKEKRVEVALTYIYGVGPSISKKVLKEVEVDPNTRAKDLNTNEIGKLKEAIEGKYKIEGVFSRRCFLINRLYHAMNVAQVFSLFILTVTFFILLS
ncbi:30S ribosomal protein S13 [Patescibacteria group bacterium]